MVLIELTKRVLALSLGQVKLSFVKANSYNIVYTTKMTIARD